MRRLFENRFLAPKMAWVTIAGTVFGRRPPFILYFVTNLSKTPPLCLFISYPLFQIELIIIQKMPSQKYRKNDDSSSGRAMAQRNQQPKPAKTSRGRVILKAKQKCDCAEIPPKVAKNVKWARSMPIKMGIMTRKIWSTNLSEPVWPISWTRTQSSGKSVSFFLVLINEF